MGSKKWLGIIAGSLVTVAAVVVFAATITEMKLLFYPDRIDVVYDADPSAIGNTRLMRLDGVKAQVDVTGRLTASGGVNKTYVIDFTAGEVANTTTPATLPVFMTVAGLVHSAAAQQLDIGYFQNGNALIFMQSTAQTLPPIYTADGLDISGDLVDGEQWEVVGGVLGASGKPFVVGVDPAFGFCLTVKVKDASGVEDLTVGFRTYNVTNQATLGTYTDYMNIGIEGSSGTTDPVPIYINTGDDGTDTNTDTTDTWADNTAKTLCTLVSAAGVVTYTIDGVAPTTTAAFTIDDGMMVVPDLRAEQASDLSDTGGIAMSKWNVFWQ